jgi:cysteine desulfurase family protein
MRKEHLPMIYMDNAATSFPKPESVYTAVNHFNRCLGGNPGRGSHQATLKAGSILLDAREALSRLFNIKDCEQIAFTANVTESLNIALKGFLHPGDHVISTSMEHNAVARPLYTLSRRGVEWTPVACAGDGSLDPEEIRKAIKPNTRMVCMLHASNLIGTIMPIAEIGKICREDDLVFLVDSAQTAGVLPLDVEAQNIDLLAFTGHKGLLGLQGTGGLYVSTGVEISPLKEGGTGSFSEHLQHPEFMPDRLESGTPNTPGIVGLLAGLEFILQTGWENIRRHEQDLTEMLLDGLREIKGIKIYGPGDSKKQTAVIAFNIDNVDCGELSMQLDYQYGIVTRSGLHCAPLGHQTIGTLESGSCRLSPGYFTTKEEIETVIKAVHDISKQTGG